MQQLYDPTIHSTSIGDDWLTPSKLRPLFQEDPALVWLELHGAAHGFFPEQPSYGLMRILERQGRRFEAAWIARLAPHAQQVCAHGGEGRLATRLRQTLALMEQNVPVIAQAALWEPNEKLYGVPDLLVHTSWAREYLPSISTLIEEYEGYVVLDLKATRKLDEPSKKIDRSYYEAQVRLYSYMLAAIQQHMPPVAFIVTHDHLNDPLVVPIRSQLGQALDEDLAEYCERYRRIAQHGHNWKPWEHAEIAPNYSYHDERWETAKQTIKQRVHGGAVEQMWNIGSRARRALHEAGITSLAALLATDPDSLPSGVLRQARPMRAIMEANRSNQPIHNPAAVHALRDYEFFVDCEFFSSLNIDYDQEWPDLHGKPMIFMIGVGWLEAGTWHYRDFIAAEESHAAELAMLEAFQDFLHNQTQGNLAHCALYHWSHAERSQMRNAADRHKLANEHLLRNLPWEDLEQAFRSHGCALPGAWNYSLKAIGRAIAALDPDYDPCWPNGLEDGGTAQVMGWMAYQCPRPLETEEMEHLRSYLEADCRATYQIMRWLRG